MADFVENIHFYCVWLFEIVVQCHFVAHGVWRNVPTDAFEGTAIRLFHRERIGGGLCGGGRFGGCGGLLAFERIDRRLLRQGLNDEDIHVLLLRDHHPGVAARVCRAAASAGKRPPFALAFELRDRRVRNVDDVGVALGLPVLVTLPKPGSRLALGGRNGSLMQQRLLAPLPLTGKVS